MPYGTVSLGAYAVPNESSSAASVLRYWRNGLADEAAGDVSKLNGGEGIETKASEVWSGTIARDVVAKVREYWEDGKQGPRAENAPVEPIPVLVALKQLARTVSHARTTSSKTVAAVFAVLNPDGKLSPSSGMPPWIVRQNLEPTSGDSSIPVVGELVTSDDWLSKNPVPSTPDWASMLSWFSRYWDAVTADSPLGEEWVVTDTVTLMPKESIGATRMVLNLYDDLLRENSHRNALLKTIASPSKPARVVDAAFRLENVTRPRGTMSTQHSLAASQADAVVAFSALEEGDVLAVQGPPGTGKTTLLQSIIATEVVRTCLAGGEPSVIFGVSTNNQAVTNINTAMNSVLAASRGQDTPPWAIRWIPGADSLGLYLPAQHRVDEAVAAGFLVASNGGIGRWSGFPDKEADAVFVGQAQESWWHNFNRAYPGSRAAQNDVGKAISVIQNDVTALQSELQSAAILLREVEAFRAWWLERTGGRLPPDGYIAEVMAIQAKAQNRLQIARTDVTRERNRVQFAGNRQRETEEGKLAVARDAMAADRDGLTHLDSLARQVEAAIAPQGFLEVMAALLPLSSLRTIAEGRQLARGRTICLDTPELAFTQSGPTDIRTLGEIRDHLNALHGDVVSRVDESERVVALQEAALTDVLVGNRAMEAELEKKRQAISDRMASVAQANSVALRQLQDMADKFSTAEARLAAALDGIAGAYGLPAPTNTDLAGFEALADRTIRHAMFQKSMRYWEGRWLLECAAIAAGTVNMKAGRAGVSARFRRWCMLTPCLITTLHSLPKAMRFAQPTEKVLYDFIDVLIMDESGQVAPHLGAPAFSLAKRAVVVGDIFQLEPIINLSIGVDQANGAKEGLSDFWVEGQPEDYRAIVAGDSGCIQSSAMMLAQAASAFTSPGKDDLRGIFLSEHRRCRTAIIEYCNELVYDGRLIPMRPEPENAPLPAMGWAHVQSTAERRGGSWVNLKEADAIAGFIDQNIDAWTAHYGQIPKATVAIITPFAGQKAVLSAAMKRVRPNLDLTIGTVHSLQGAEARIVIFSMTSSGNNGRPHYASKPNLLNVAVSRAQDSFIVIGDMTVLRRHGSDSVSLLGKRMFSIGEEISGVDGNYRFSSDILRLSRRLSSLDEHLDVLQNAVGSLQSGHQVVIVSPFLRMGAVKHPPFIDLCRDAIRRGASIHVVTDRYFHERDLAVAEPAIQELKGAGVDVTIVDGVHAKMMLTHNSITEGSFNWLAAQRTGKYVRYETSWHFTGDDVSREIQDARNDLVKLGVKL